ncbi:hypothetical protein MTO96_013293 [Rhipicephalus appendiculatus]
MLSERSAQRPTPWRTAAAATAARPFGGRPLRRPAQQRSLKTGHASTFSIKWPTNFGGVYKSDATPAAETRVSGAGVDSGRCHEIAAGGGTPSAALLAGGIKGAAAALKMPTGVTRLNPQPGTVFKALNIRRGGRGGPAAAPLISARASPERRGRLIGERRTNRDGGGAADGERPVRAGGVHGMASSASSITDPFTGIAEPLSAAAWAARNGTLTGLVSPPLIA